MGRPDDTDRHGQRTRTAPGPAPASPTGEPAGPAARDDLLTIDQVITELQVSRAAFYRWRRQGTGPAAVRLPGGGVRIPRSALNRWLASLHEDAEEESAS